VSPFVTNMRWSGSIGRAECADLRLALVIDDVDVVALLVGQHAARGTPRTVIGWTPSSSTETNRLGQFA